MGFGILKGSLYSSFCYMREIEVRGGGKIIHYKSTDPWRKEGELGCKNPCLTPSLLFSGSSWKKMFDRSDFPASGRKKIYGKKRNFFIFFRGERNVCSKCCPPPKHLAIYNETMISLFLHNFPPPKRVFVRTFCKGKGSVGDNFSPPPPIVSGRAGVVWVRQIRRKNFCLSRCVCHRSQEEEEKIEDTPPPPQSWELILTWVMTWAACLPARGIFFFPANAFQSSMESRFF